MSSLPSEWAVSPESLVVGLARTGDREAFAELMRRRQSWIRNLLRRLCGDTALADDLAQQAFLMAWKDIRKLREPARFATWLRQIAVNTWRQQARKQQPEVAESPIVEAADGASSPAVFMDLDTALGQLQGNERLCVVLSYAEGMTHGEITSMTGLPLGTVKSHVRRGAEKLKVSLEDYGPQARSSQHD